MAFLRFVGVVNASVWFGAALFFTLGIGPAFFSSEMKTLLGRPHAGAAAQIVLERYYLLHQICGIVAVVHLLSEWLYTGKPLQKAMIGLAVGLLALGLVGGKWLQPKLKTLHREMFVAGTALVRQPVTPQQKAAERSFRVWHGVAQGLNLVGLVGLLVYLARVADSHGGIRLFNPAKFRG